MRNNDLYDIIKYIVHKETIFLRHYIGKVVDINDEIGKGRINVIVFDLNYGEASSGFWAYPRDKSSIITPKIGDWVEIYFRNGDRNFPVYIGGAVEMQDMIPKNYSGKPSIDVIYEDRENKVSIVFDKILNEMKIGKSNHQGVARETDPVINNFSITENSIWHTWFIALNALVPGYPGIAGSGSISGKINSGSSQIKVGDK